MIREIQMEKILSNYYLMGVVFFILIVYAKSLLLTLIFPIHRTIATDLLWIPLQLCFIMVVWAMTRCIISDPGRVPAFWGQLMDDVEQKKRRYCLICHIFKPERCHHCSNCQRCVLNMDHHCPWIGNCVGYHNRKFFMLFLFYINVTVLFALIILIIQSQQIVMDIIYDWTIVYENYKVVPTLFLLVMVASFGGVIFNFFLFHIELVSTNKTTIDTLELKRNNQSTDQPNVYDVGYLKQNKIIQFFFIRFQQNWLQVMGENKILWFFPMFSESGRPKGDGVHWERNQQVVTLTEQNQTHRTQTNQNLKSDVSQHQR